MTTDFDTQPGPDLSFALYKKFSRFQFCGTTRRTQILNAGFPLAQLQRLVIAPAQLQTQIITLTAEQQHYLHRVLRLQSGDRFIAMDGQGQSWLAMLRSDAQAQVMSEIASQTELPLAVTLVAALPKGNGFDEVVRQVTELGATTIVPVISDRTLLQPSPQKLTRWQRLVQEAAEQSERQIVPTLLEPASWQDWLQQTPIATQPSVTAYICVTRVDAPHLLDCLLSQPRDANLMAPDSSSCVSHAACLILAIGPEGGWTDAEVAAAIAAGYQPVSLGKRILRAVTAPTVALAIVAAALEHQK